MPLFYLTTIPGLESVAHLELCEKWRRASDFFNLPQYPEVQISKGGLEFSAPLAMGFYLQKNLRVNNRMLLRLASFEAPHERDFIKGLEALPWKDYLSPQQGYDIQFTSKSSKISMSRQVDMVLNKVLSPLKLKKKKDGTTIYVRLFRDQCNISFDCSGEATFRRAQGDKGSVASLRSSTAAGLLRLLLQGVHRPSVLIDPMCGSGTFLKEALSLNTEMKREFQFEQFPVFKTLELPKINVESEEGYLKAFYAFDNNSKAIQVAQKNLKDTAVHIEKADLFASDQGLVQEEGLEKIVILNPPWGKRLPGSNQDLLKAVYEKYEPQRIGLLMPSYWRLSEIPMEGVRDIPILNSGVENRFVLFTKP